MNNPPPYFNRRAMLKLVAVAGAASACPGRMFGQTAGPAAPSVRAITDFLETLKKDDDGYGWGDQNVSHLTPTFGVVGAYRVLKVTPPHKDALVRYVRTHHPRELKKLEHSAFASR